MILFYKRERPRGVSLVKESSRREGVRLGMQTREEIVDGEKFLQGKGR